MIYSRYVVSDVSVAVGGRRCFMFRSILCRCLLDCVLDCTLLIDYNLIGLLLHGKHKRVRVYPVAFVSNHWRSKIHKRIWITNKI